MAFGALFRNGSNETVIDENFRTLQVLRTFTTSNVVGNYGMPGHDTGYAFHIGRQSTASIIFAKLASGRAFTMDPGVLNRVYSNWDDPLELMEVVLSDSLPSPKGYGMAVWDSGGNVMFNSNYSLLGAGQVYQTPSWSLTTPPSWSVTTSAEWVMVAIPGIYKHYLRSQSANGLYLVRFAYIGPQRTSNGYTFKIIPIKSIWRSKQPLGANDQWYGGKGSFVTAAA